MLRSCFAILAASCAFGHSVEVGVLLQSKDFQRAALIPAARYTDGKWSEMHAKGLPQQWQLWGAGFEGAVVHIRSVCGPEDQCGLPCRPNLCWESDFRGRRPSSRFDLGVGLVISQAIPVVAFRKLLPGTAEWDAAEAIFQPEAKTSLDSQIDTTRINNEKLNPARIPIKPERILKTFRPIEWPHHFLRLLREPLIRQSVRPTDCGLRRLPRLPA